jgi:membrane protein
MLMSSRADVYRRPDGRARSASARESPAPLATLRNAVRSAQQHAVGDAAAAITYYGFTALPAAVMASAGLAVLIGGQRFVDAIVARLSTVLPADAISILQGTLTRAVDARRSSVVFAAVGIVVALWAATGAMTAVMRGLNRAYGIEDMRGAVRKRLVALALLAIGVAGMALCAGLLVLGPVLSAWIARTTGLGGIVTAIWWAGQWPLLALGLAAATAGMLALGPDHRRRPRLVTAGPAVAVLLWIAVSLLFSLYVSRFGSYNKAWGSLSAVVVTIVWMWLGATALLLGAEVDAQLESASAATRSVRP